MVEYAAMHLRLLECLHFRCLSEIRFEPAAGLNVILGDNGQGKTSLLEALLYVATSKSHRTNVDGDLVQFSKEQFRVSAVVRRLDREVSLEANWRLGAKRFRVNGVPQTRLSDVLGRVNVVLFSPEDVELVKGGASARRRFLDMEISQIYPSYLAALQQYRQALRQRNELLRSAAPDSDLLEVWDVQLGEHGAAVIRGREDFIRSLSEAAARAYTNIAGEESLTLAYRPAVKQPEELPDVLAKARSSDIRQRQTQRGPHRDDLEILIDGRPARSHSSQGQQKTAALALKLAELDLITAGTREPPILMLDEVLAELDGRRADRFFRTIGSEVQCLMTTTETGGYFRPYIANATLFRITRGHLEKA